MISVQRRRFVITAAAAFVLGAVLVLWILFQPESGSWIAVYTDDALNVRETSGYLKERGISVVSESELWVLLDDFSELRQIPLDRYDEYIEPFDPRNDGYAETLRSFFSREAERRFFVAADDLSQTALELTLDEAVRAGGGTLKRLEYSGTSCFHVTSLLLLASAFVVSAALLGRRALFSLFCLFPVPAFLSCSGPAGIVAAGFLLAVYCLMGTALEERFRSPRTVSRVRFRSFTGELLGWFRTFSLELAGALAGLILYWISCTLGTIPLSVSFPAFCFFIPLLLLPRWAESAAVDERFLPVSIRKETPFLLFPPVLPVFTVAFALAFGVVVLRGGHGTDMGQSGPARPESVRKEPGEAGRALGGGIEWPAPPARERYYRHAVFQREFSRHSVRNRDTAAPPGEAYGTYSLGADGLLNGFTELPPEKTFPPYPEILPELGREAKGVGGNSGYSFRSPWAGLVLLALMVILSVAALAGMLRYQGPLRQRGQGALFVP